MSTYRGFINTLKAVSLNTPTQRTPKELNFHLYQPGPFRKIDKTSLSLASPFLMPTKLNSERYYRSALNEESSKSIQDFPLPSILKKETLGPNSCLTSGTALGKVF
jgi:hypothetical protein